MQSMRETLHTRASNHEDELLKSLGLPTSNLGMPFASVG
jgi:hypothetical protein